MGKSRFQVEVTDDQNALLDHLIEDAGLAGKRDLFNNALSILYWAVERSKEGRAIASVAPDGQSLRELEMPALLTLREKFRRQSLERQKKDKGHITAA